MSTLQEGLLPLVRKWSDISSKVKAAFAGGVTAGAVTTSLGTIAPSWHPTQWEITGITLAITLLSAYFAKDKLSISAVNSAGAVTATTVVDASTLPDVELPSWVTDQLAAQAAPVGAADPTPVANPQVDTEAAPAKADGTPAV